MKIGDNVYFIYEDRGVISNITEPRIVKGEVININHNNIVVKTPFPVGRFLSNNERTYIYTYEYCVTRKKCSANLDTVKRQIIKLITDRIVKLLNQRFDLIAKVDDQTAILNKFKNSDSANLLTTISPKYGVIDEVPKV